MLYLIATSRQAAEDFCKDMHFDSRSKYVRIFTRSNQVRGIRLKENDGYEFISRPNDKPDYDLFEYWKHIILTTRG